jgi:hypothetical protein
MIANNIVQAAIVSWLQADANVIGSLPEAAVGVKEAQYQGSDYKYPAVRVRVVRQTPDPTKEQCDHARFIGSIRCYAEGPSSLPADRLAGIVNARLHRAQIAGGTVGTDAFYIPRVYCEGLSGAIRLNERLWVSEVTVGGNVIPSDDMGGS